MLKNKLKKKFKGTVALAQNQHSFMKHSQDVWGQKLMHSEHPYAVEDGCLEEMLSALQKDETNHQGPSQGL